MMNRYGMAMHPDRPMTVKIMMTLKGQAVENQVIKVGMLCDNVRFRYKKDTSYIFFLTPYVQKAKKNVDSSVARYWRVVSDYFGVQPYSLTLARMIHPESQPLSK